VSFFFNFACLISIFKKKKKTFSAHHPRVRARAQDIPRQVHRDHGGGAPHPAQGERPDVLAHLELVDDGGRERRHRVERGVVDDQGVKVRGLEPGPLHEALDAAEHDELGLRPSTSHRDLDGLRHADLDGVGQESPVAEAGDLDDLVHEVERGLVVALRFFFTFIVGAAERERGGSGEEEW